MLPSSTLSESTVRRLHSTRPSRHHLRRIRPTLGLETLAERRLLRVPSASFIKQDTTMQGNWIGTYRSQGYDVIGNSSATPSQDTIGKGSVAKAREHKSHELRKSLPPLLLQCNLRHPITHYCHRLWWQALSF